MLSDMIGESSGSIIGIRVLPSDGGPPKLELTFRGTGELFGIPVEDMGTYVQTMREDGSFYAEGELAFMTPEGDTATWKGFGIGKPTGRGHGARFAVCGAYHTATGKLAPLMGWPVVTEFEADESEKYRWQGWQWTF